MPDDPDPPRKSYGLKPREFDRVNPPPERASPDPNDVRATLRANLTRANDAGQNDLAPKPPRRSRRKRDYLLALIGGNLVFAVCTIISPIFGGAGFILYNVGLTWVMWAVMDDY